LKSISYLAIAAATLMTGCATQKVMTETPASGGQARFVIPSDYVTNPASIPAQYTQRVRESSSFRAEYRTHEPDWTYGVRVEGKNNSVVVSYVNSQSSGLEFHNLSGAFNYAQSQQGANIVFDVTCPASLKEDSKYDAIFAGLYKLWVTKEQAASDLQGICNRAALRFPHRETGEFNVNYPDNSVYANFERKSQAYDGWTANERTVRKDDIAKFRWYLVKDGGAQRRVGITVYPYRNGSKITYVWESEITCRGNAPCDFDPTAGQRVKDAVVAIAND
jgi:hypothetical protein